ncbi:hypothetical protein [Okeania sp. SIO2B3]|uniref:hypothetical protein n=1 Tax=Okeania sp. SIO2B3 TaxID=2607784 RepID=UPI0013BEE213|nr:hypothetical protein [Okeania sp. SIO2B3]NET43941.1 hypothetical protein [Okeania sp. SIO2B3]
MTQDITPWLNEIKALQEKIVKLQTELNVAQDSASKWRQLYNTEAQQRRTETQLAQETIQTLKAQAQKLQGFPSVEESIDESATTIEQQIENLQTLAEFKAQIIKVVQERDRAFAQVQKLTEALEQEQVNHTNTRTSLTNALADAVDILAKAKANKQQKSEITPDIQSKTEANIQAQNQIPLEESFSPNAAKLPPN